MLLAHPASVAVVIGCQATKQRAKGSSRSWSWNRRRGRSGSCAHSLTRSLVLSPKSLFHILTAHIHRLCWLAGYSFAHSWLFVVSLSQTQAGQPNLTDSLPARSHLLAAKANFDLLVEVANALLKPANRQQHQSSNPEKAHNDRLRAPLALELAAQPLAHLSGWSAAGQT